MTESFYKEKAAEVARKVQHYFNDLENWEIVKKTKNITISRKQSPEFEGHIYKGEGIVNAPPETVFTYLDPLPEPAPRLKWDKSMKKIELLENISEALRIIRTFTASACVGLIAPRDFIDVTIKVENDKFISTNAVSFSHEKYPVDEKYVRGWNYPCGLLCCKIPDDNTKTKVISLLQPDIAGMVPRKLVESALPSSMIDFFTGLRRQLKEDGKLVKDHETIPYDDEKDAN